LAGEFLRVEPIAPLLAEALGPGGLVTLRRRSSADHGAKR